MVGMRMRNNRSRDPRDARQQRELAIDIRAGIYQERAIRPFQQDGRTGAPQLALAARLAALMARAGNMRNRNPGCRAQKAQCDALFLTHIKGLRERLRLPSAAWYFNSTYAVGVRGRQAALQTSLEETTA